MPTLTGQNTPAVFSPRALTTPGSVVALISRAKRYHSPFDVPMGSTIVFIGMPCTAGSTPVIIVVCDGYVTVGVTPIPPSANTPSFARRRSVGTFDGPGLV